MVYQLVSSHRTGSSLLNSFCVNENDGFGFSEIFLDPSYASISILRYGTVEEKFEFLEYYKSKVIHFSIKIFPAKILYQDLKYKKLLTSYLQDYKIVTIKRNPLDSFLSSCYQDETKWKIAHREKNKVPKIIPKFSIDLDKINIFCHKWNTDFNFIKSLDIHHIFLYENLTVAHLQKYFKTNFVPNTKPMNIDYRSLISNIDEVEEKFNEYHFETL